MDPNATEYVCACSFLFAETPDLAIPLAKPGHGGQCAYARKRQEAPDTMEAEKIIFEADSSAYTRTQSLERPTFSFHPERKARIGTLSSIVVIP